MSPHHNITHAAAFRQLVHFPALQAELGECWQLDEDIHGGGDVHIRAVGQVEILEHPQLLKAFRQQTGEQLVQKQSKWSQLTFWK